MHDLAGVPYQCYRSIISTLLQVTWCTGLKNPSCTYELLPPFHQPLVILPLMSHRDLLSYIRHELHVIVCMQSCKLPLCACIYKYYLLLFRDVYPLLFIGFCRAAIGAVNLLCPAPLPCPFSYCRPVFYYWMDGWMCLPSDCLGSAAPYVQNITTWL